MMELIASVLAAIRIVCPSAGDFAASSMPIIWPAPGRLSTTNCRPNDSESFSATARAMMSVPPPAAEGTIKRTGLDGYPLCACAQAQNEKNRSSTERRIETRRIGLSAALEQQLIAVLDFLRALLRVQALGDIGDYAQARRPAVEIQVEGNNLDVNQLAVLLLVPPHAVPIAAALILEGVEQLRYFLLG